jgi:hypothetical protein
MIDFKIGIIDDDKSKVTQIMMRLEMGCDGIDENKKKKYSGFKLSPIEIALNDSIDNMIDEIKEKNIDCLLIDYKLQSYKTINFSGVDVAYRVYDCLADFPIFILTSYDEELFMRELFNAYQIFDFNRYINEDSERIELNFKIIEQILKYKREASEWENELLLLLPKAGKTAEIDEKILHLDNLIERRIGGKSSLNSTLKKELSVSKIDTLLTKLDFLLEGNK